MDEEEKLAPDTAFVRDEDFFSIYSNNVQFESSAWDVKMIFGQLDQSHRAATVRQDIAIIMAWPQAKIAAYYLLVNLTISQGQNGVIHVPSHVLPLRPNPEDPTLDETGRRTVRYLAWVYDQFFSSTPYIPPGVELPPPEAPTPTAERSLRQRSET